jgi:hypothetical protein
VTVKLEQLLEHELSEKKRVGGAPTHINEFMIITD